MCMMSLDSSCIDGVVALVRAVAIPTLTEMWFVLPNDGLSFAALHIWPAMSASRARALPDSAKLTG